MKCTESSSQIARFSAVAMLTILFLPLLSAGGSGQDMEGFVDGDGNVVGPCSCCASISCNPSPAVPLVDVQPILIEAGYTFTNTTGVFTCSNCAGMQEPSCQCNPATPDSGVACGSVQTIKEYAWKRRTFVGSSYTDTLIFSGTDFSDVRYECTPVTCPENSLIWLEVQYQCDAIFTCPDNPGLHPVQNRFYSFSSEVGIGDFEGTDHYPNQPGEVVISPSWILPDGTLTCINCPPQAPYDDYHPEGYPFTWLYDWSLDGTIIQSGDSYVLDCSPPGCEASPKGTLGCSCDLGNVTLVAHVFDLNGFSNVSNKSNVAIITDEPPEFYPALSLFAILIPLFVLAMVYMGTYLFSIPHYRPMLQDELIQVLITGALLLCIIAVSSLVNDYMKFALVSANNTSVMSDSITVTGAMNTASETLKNLDGNVSAIYFGIEGASNDLGKEASKSIFCNFKGVGFTLVNCSPLNAFRGALMPAGFAASAAIMDLYAQRLILSFARYTAFAVIIPVGLLFRCFKFSRAAGNALIAIGFGFYTVYPLSIVATDKLLHGSNPSSSSFKNFMKNKECDPQITSTPQSRGYVLDRARDMIEFDRVNSTVYVITVRVVLASVLNLIITLGFIRSFARILGSELEISSLARIS